MRYIQELEHKVQILQTKTTTLSTRLTMLQVCLMELLCIFDFVYVRMELIPDALVCRGTLGGLATHNNELKIRLQAMEQQAQLRYGMLLMAPFFISFGEN